MQVVVPVIILTGFLGSGKTTLLSSFIQTSKHKGLKPAVLMNEAGEVNLDGQLLGEDVSMTALTGGCICCTVRADLGLQLHELIEQHKPDLIFVECSGAASPIEVIDGVTDASMTTKLQLQAIITLVDAPQWIHDPIHQFGKSGRLMKEQVRAATHLIVNKMDKLAQQQVEDVQRTIIQLNPSASFTMTTYAQLEHDKFLDTFMSRETSEQRTLFAVCSHESSTCSCSSTSTPEPHEHVMAYTHYFQEAIQSESFEHWLRSLPNQVFRAKGIVKFTDTASLFMFQYAWKEVDFIPIRPQGNVPLVAVMIGDHFDPAPLRESLLQMEREASTHAEQ